MDHSEIEGETQIGTFGDIDPLKATPGKAAVEKKAKPAKVSQRSYQRVLSCRFGRCADDLRRFALF
ncbi:MAG: hypothetical protein MPW15_17515 [Candidatus Manganitrophus sp.]|nr:hypothetical protein [Candidatus Manganitrophus sp.]